MNLVERLRERYETGQRVAGAAVFSVANRDGYEAAERIEALEAALEAAYARLVRLGDDGNVCIATLSSGEPKQEQGG